MPDFNVGFAILAHDGANGGSALDLNVYADIVSEALGGLQGIAAAETAARYAGTYRGGNDSVAVLNVTEDGPGIAVQELRVDGVDVRAQAARQLGIATVANLDFRLYPAIVGERSLRHEFVAVFQDRSAPVDMGTPTCITWQQVGSTAGLEYRYAFSLTDGEVASKFEASTGSFRLHKLI